MRRLAQDFSGAMRERDVVQRLRALPQPIYRYKVASSDEDGAVFAYVSGTDPELLVVIESRNRRRAPMALRRGPLFKCAVGA